MSRKLVFSARKKDFRVDTFRCSGKGGQNVNKRDTGVRLTHIETGLSAECTEHKSQAQNKRTAFEKLADKLVDFYLAREEVEKTKRYGAGTKTIRTYNESKDRVIDHDTGKRYSYHCTVGKNDISIIIDDRATALASEH